MANSLSNARTQNQSYFGIFNNSQTKAEIEPANCCYAISLDGHTACCQSHPVSMCGEKITHVSTRRCHYITVITPRQINFDGFCNNYFSPAKASSSMKKRNERLFIFLLMLFVRKVHETHFHKIGSWCQRRLTNQ